MILLTENTNCLSFNSICCEKIYNIFVFVGHNHVRSLRQSLIGLAGQTGADVDILRQRVAECLYTLQQFYSNTNWVELNGDNILKEFGTFDIYNKSILHVDYFSFSTFVIKASMNLLS